MESHTDDPILTERFQRALTFAVDVHRTQLRKGTAIPYMAHLMAVSALVLEFGGSEDAAIAALLHDAIEDSDDGAAMKTQIAEAFGDRVADIVMGCSDAIAVPGQDKAPWRARKEKYLEHLRHETDRDVLLVSACDKLHNARASVSDLRSSGDQFWAKFSGGKSGSLWYYEQLSGSYDGKVPDRLAAELRTTVGAMKALAGDGTTLS